MSIKESAYRRASKRLGRDVRPAPALSVEDQPVPEGPVREAAAPQDHDYGSAPKPGNVNITSVLLATSRSERY